MNREQTEEKQRGENSSRLGESEENWRKGNKSANENIANMGSKYDKSGENEFLKSSFNVGNQHAFNENSKQGGIFPP